MTSKKNAKPKPIIRNNFDRERVSIRFPKYGLTKQSFKDECDINRIMDKYQKTGAVSHFNRHSPRYGDHSGMDFHEAMNVITETQRMFGDLPSTVRNKFANDPGLFLDFIQNPENADEMAALGLFGEMTAKTPSDGLRADLRDEKTPIEPQDQSDTGAD
jgi:phage internal scaffolding protein